MKLSEWKGPWPVYVENVKPCSDGSPFWALVDSNLFDWLQHVLPGYSGVQGIVSPELWVVKDWFEEPAVTYYESSSMYKIKYEYFPAAPPALVETMSSDHKKCTCVTLLNGHHNDCLYNK